jgi:hypothetical protein
MAANTLSGRERPTAERRGNGVIGLDVVFIAAKLRDRGSL